MKNKNVRAALSVLVIVIGLLIYFGTRPDAPIETAGPIDSSEDAIHISMRARKNRWTWEPKVLEVNVGDRVIITATNEDAYTHGLTILAFGISKVLPGRSETIIDFVVDQEGDFDFYCSVPCGAGHNQMTGRVIVSPAVNIGGNQNIDVLGETAVTNFIDGR